MEITMKEVKKEIMLMLLPTIFILIGLNPHNINVNAVIGGCILYYVLSMYYDLNKFIKENKRVIKWV